MAAKQAPPYIMTLERLDALEAQFAAILVNQQIALEALEALAGRPLTVTRAPLNAPTAAPQPVGDTEFPDADTPYSRAITLADFVSLAFTLYKRGEPNPSERIMFTSHELLEATKDGWTTWPETGTDGKITNVMQKDDGMFGSAGGWVPVHVKTRTDGPVVWLEITDGNWGTVTNVEVVHG